ncbi:MAG: DUF1573 domain-containing protein [Cytophagales bacterium]|nr:DUF1573 domain-containing protein [Bernardetiaceae bacterium]MDW8209885.1 DUF1573 domain-containing protein [Cytophagales bacterium]
MRKFIALLLTLFVSIALQAQQPEDKYPFLSFVKREQNFGDIKRGTIVSHQFEFTNTGNAPLVLADVRVTCGCTVTQWTRQPIMPGEKGVIVVQFNSADHIGPQNKVVTVLSNAKNDIEHLLIRANVIP